MHLSRIVVAEDDAYLREELVNTFIKRGYSAEGISSFHDTEGEILSKKPDLLVLDINLPVRSGFELCRSLKSKASFPILILTARDALPDELYALGLGADDFLTKPCHPDRLCARVDRLLQTYGKVKSMVESGGIILDFDTYKVVYKDSHIVLGETEGKILKLLLEESPQVVSRQQLYKELWGGEEYVDENILQVNMTRLRKSLEAIGLRDTIWTARGQGYRLEVHNI